MGYLFYLGKSLGTGGSNTPKSTRKVSIRVGPSSRVNLQSGQSSAEYVKHSTLRIAGPTPRLSQAPAKPFC